MHYVACNNYPNTLILLFGPRVSFCVQLFENCWKLVSHEVNSHWQADDWNRWVSSFVQGLCMLTSARTCAVRSTCIHGSWRLTWLGLSASANLSLWEYNERAQSISRGPFLKIYLHVGCSHIGLNALPAYSMIHYMSRTVHAHTLHRGLFLELELHVQ